MDYTSHPGKGRDRVPGHPSSDALDAIERDVDAVHGACCPTPPIAGSRAAAAATGDGAASDSDGGPCGPRTRSWWSRLWPRRGDRSSPAPDRRS